MCALGLAACPKSSPGPAPSGSTSSSSSSSAAASASNGPPHDFKDFTDDELGHAMDLERSIAMVQVKAVTAQTDVGTKAQGARYDFQLLEKLYGSPTSIALEHEGNAPRLVQDRMYVVLVERTFKELVDAREVDPTKFKDVAHDYQTRIDKLQKAADAAASASASASAAPSTSAPTKPSASAKPPAATPSAKK
jgi:hypothetical protein